MPLICEVFFALGRHLIWHCEAEVARVNQAPVVLFDCFGSADNTLLLCGTRKLSWLVQKTTRAFVSAYNDPTHCPELEHTRSAN
jgi:hypothetical protein